MLGADVDLPNWMMSQRQTKLKKHKDGRLIFETAATEHDKPLQGWLRQKKQWKRIFQVRTINNGNEEMEAAIDEDIIRHVVTPGGSDAGWCLKAEERWIEEPGTNIKIALKSLGYGVQDVDKIMGSQIFKPWMVVNRPFEAEYPGDRQWNKNAPQLAYLPSPEVGEWNTWRKIFDHIGRNLDHEIKEHWWCQANHIRSGAEYLILWYACLLQKPTSQLPYIFLHGKQKSGKSIFHEAFELLVTKGVQKINHVFESQFNGEMEGAILCVLEEIDLGTTNKKAYNKIKEWVTSLNISIHHKRITPYQTINTCHFVHCANSHKAAPIFPDDTRITMVHVEPLPVEQRIPKVEVLIPALRKEAPYFLSHLLSLEIPAAPDRLALPAIATSMKEAVATGNMNALEKFITEECHHAPGEKIPFGTFWKTFQDWLDPHDAEYWTKNQTSRSLPPQYPSGNPHGSSTRHIANISFTKPTINSKKELVLIHKKLVERDRA